MNNFNKILSKLAVYTTLALSIPFTTLAAGRGGMDSGGGDAIRCSDGKLYAWDFFQGQIREDQIHPEYLESKTAAEILQKMVANLNSFSPSLAFRLKEFTSMNQDPFKKSKRLWHFGTNPLVDLADEARLRIPRSCTGSSDPSQIKLFQAVIRQAGERIIYEADSETLNGLESNHPVQLSFLLVHEFLRDFTSNAVHIARINAILHRDLSRESAEDINNAIRGFGITKMPVFPFGKLKLVNGFENGSLEPAAKGIQMKFDLLGEFPGEPCHIDHSCSQKELDRAWQNQYFYVLLSEKVSIHINPNENGSLTGTSRLNLSVIKIEQKAFNAIGEDRSKILIALLKLKPIATFKNATVGVQWDYLTPYDKHNDQYSKLKAVFKNETGQPINFLGKNLGEKHFFMPLGRR
jgi:hypothetical protein